jgi:hypothetical protein
MPEPLTSIDDLEGMKRAIIDDYQRMNGVEIRLTDALDALKVGIRAQSKVFEDRSLIDEVNLKEFKQEASRFNAQIFLAFQAIRAREAEQFYAAIIEQEGDYLQKKIVNGEPFQGDDWADWEVHQSKLESAMGRWLELADGWHPKVRSWINEVVPESLTSPEWGEIDDLFQRHGQAIMYKTQVAKFNNWLRLRNHVATAIYMAAFGGPHADEVLQTIPGGGPTVESVRQ